MTTIDNAYGFNVIEELETLNKRYPTPIIGRAVLYIKLQQRTRMNDALRINELETKLREYEAREAALRG